LIGLVASILLAPAKLVAGIVGCSTALIADSIGSLLVWQALKVAARPADDRHPWGYGKASVSVHDPPCRCGNLGCRDGRRMAPAV